MQQIDLELILMRQLASCLATPIFLVDPDGNLVFYNEPAEKILGRRYEETGEMPLSEWSTAFRPFDEHEETLPPERLPLVVALTQQKPAHKRFWIRGLDGRKRQIEVTAFPLIGQRRQLAGAVSIFWEVKRTKT
jgi:PAS domain-containing protein